MDIVTEIQRFNAGRDPERLRLKYRAMRGSALAFLRGSCHLFYARVAAQGGLPASPLGWICGDLHLENFGSYKGDNRLVYFDVNDFDEAALAPACWDLLRWLVSLDIAAEALELGAGARRELIDQALASYAAALAAGRIGWVDRDQAEGVVGALLDGLRERRRPEYIAQRTELRGHQRVLRCDGKRALPASEAARAAVTRCIDDFATSQPQPAFFRVLDVARRIAGTGSLGLERYAVLVRGKSDERDERDGSGHYILDLKAAQPSALTPYLPGAQPAWASPAQRIVALQQRLQAVPMAFLHAVTAEGLGGRSFVLRALQPTEDRVSIAPGHGAAKALAELATTQAALIAWSQLRSAGRQGSAIADAWIDFGADPGWRAALVEAVRLCGTQLRRDAKAFQAACDAGAFDA